MDLDIVKWSPSGNKLVVTLKGVDKTATVGQVKKLIHKQKSGLYPERVALRPEPKAKSLPESTQLNNIEQLSKSNELYFKDLGPQIGWSTVFLCEYAGPLFCYLLTYFRPAIMHGRGAALLPYHYSVHIAVVCWTFHYAKRILETLFVHRFSHATMPIGNLFRNSLYYWGFALYIGYYINHPKYTPASFGDAQIYAGLLGFIFSEMGNFSIHMALRNLRPPGTKERRIPMPTSDPFTWIFNLVSCPNYTFEISAWCSFILMTQALPAAIFTSIGGGQMVLWALTRHRNYRKEFSNYPRGRKAIFPFVI